jgi:tetratricopeptide (TPR) repeat protein
VVALERAVKDDPRNWDAWQKLGIAYGASGAEEQGPPRLRQGHDIAPKSGEVNANYGAYLMKLGEVDAAIERFEVAKADLTYRNTANVLNNLGVALYAKGSYDEAIEVLSDAISARAQPVAGAVPSRAVLRGKKGPQGRGRRLRRGDPALEGHDDRAYVRGCGEPGRTRQHRGGVCVPRPGPERRDAEGRRVPDEVLAYEALVVQAHELYATNCTGTTRP